jgi:hypothetical protein
LSDCSKKLDNVENKISLQHFDRLANPNSVKLDTIMKILEEGLSSNFEEGKGLKRKITTKILEELAASPAHLRG